MYTLYIGNKNYSTWSLRAWVLMKTAGIPLREQRLPLYEADSSARIRSQSPSGKVPCLHDGPVVVWDSLAIAEYQCAAYQRHLVALPAMQEWLADAMRESEHIARFDAPVMQGQQQ
jgi:glutathione S-transferase